MSSRFVTQTTQELIPVLVVCPVAGLKAVLSPLLSAAGFVLIEDEGTGEPPYAIFIFDVGQPLSEIYRKTHSRTAHTKVFYISFDSSRVDEVQTRVPKLFSFQYMNVLSALPAPLSQLDRSLRTLAWQSDKTPIGAPTSMLWYEDVCEHLIHELLSGKPKSGVYSGETQVSYTQLVRDVREKLGVAKGKREEIVELLPTQGSTISGRTLGEIVDQVSQFLETLRPTEIEEVIPKKTTSLHVKTSVRKLKHRIRLMLVVSSCLLGVVIGGGYAWYELDTRALTQGLKSIVYQQPTVSDALFSDVSNRLSRVTLMSSVSDSLFSWAKQGRTSDVLQALPLVSVGLEGNREMGKAQAILIAAYQVLMQGKTGDSTVLLKSADAHLDTAYKDFSLLQARFVQDDTLLPEELGGKEIQSQLAADIPILRKNITTLRSVINVLPHLVDDGKQHAFAFVLADSTNVRGSGGAVESVAVLSFDRGKLLTNQVYPAATLNQLLTGSVNAPDEIKTFLHAQNWTLSDATWDAFYGKVATQISWFLGKALSRPIDGVIVIPSKVLPQFLAATGTMKLSTGESVSATSYQSLLEDRIGKLSGQPDSLDSFYNDIFSSLVTHFQQAGQDETHDLLRTLTTLFMNSDAFIGVGDTESARAFSALSWDGNPLTPECPSEFAAPACRVSTAYEVENNLGQNNVGAFIKRSQVHTIRVGTDVLLHSRTITLTNTASLLAWPYGTYQVLTKLLIDSDAQVQGVSINDQSLTPDRFSLNKEGGKIVVRLATDVPVGATSRIRIFYTTSGIPAANSSLVFLEQKQAGTGEDPFTLIITYPDNFTAKRVAPRADVGRSSLTFMGKHDANHLYGIGF